MPESSADAVTAAAAVTSGVAFRLRGPGNRALGQGAGHPRPDGKTEEELIVELSATTTTPPGGMRGPASPAVLLPGPLEQVAAILDWYGSHARDLPWRRAAASPWAVLVSEIMLQQTPVARVLPAYEAWLTRWPTPPALAAAAPADAVRQWGRLGYPRRALRLHAAAQVISERHGGEVPSSVDALLALPGVGSYTAAAVASFAFGQRHAVLDTNVRRVLARMAAGRQWPA